ncbi:TetR/AcrR family transcriptional regulator [Kitasatospora sp. NPDC048194]|uniref:TetR/AcrR family transcriptional regulator n=1 Tax=Kitasatospora sp. NPDC048194 TaxID=3364045 RepID=UPI00371A931F
MDAHSDVPPPAATRRDRNRQRVKERVYASAMTLISQKGYAGASVEEIAEHADVARGTFFNHFPRKEALISAWAEARRERLMERLEQAGAEQRPDGGGPPDRPRPAEGLRQCLTVLGALNEEEPELSRAMLTAWVRSGRPLEEEPYLGAVLARLVESGRARGEIVTGLSSEQVGEALRDLYLGALYRWTRRATRGEDPGRLTGELAAVLELVLHGLAAREPFHDEERCPDRSDRPEPQHRPDRPDPQHRPDRPD